jgi:hypothetical protein
VRFNDDAGLRWDLDTDLSLREVDATLYPEEILEMVEEMDETPDQPSYYRDGTVPRPEDGGSGRA